MPRLPPSLKWLIDRRGRVAGEIKKMERELAKCRRAIETYKALNNDLGVLRKLLESVDRTLALHEVQVEPELIPTIRSQEVAVRLPHGLLTRTVFECLRTAEKPIVSSSEVVAFITKRLEDLGYAQDPRSNLNRRLKCCLQTMYYQGHLIRHHDQRTQDYGLWSLAERKFTLDIQIPDGAPDSSP